MKRLPLVILVLGVLLVAVVTGCGRSPRYDGRLVAADSLMQSDPDSALALVEGVCRDSLSSEGDRAYRDLLLTQARYRCYVTATSDSDINRALTYYRSHPREREKLTRAYIYKGAVMDELGLPDSAMHYYKRAETVADTADYFNLGYVKMCMGKLYQEHFSMDGKEIEKYEQALACLKNTRNTHSQIVCLNNLGCLYRLKYPDKADTTLRQAMSLAKSFNDTTNYLLAANNLIQLYYYYKQFNRAQEMIWHLLGQKDIVMPKVFYTNVASVYASLGLPDSADMFLREARNRYNFNSNVIDSLTIMESEGMVAKCRGDIRTYELLASRCKHISDSLLSLGATVKIIKVETAQEQRLLKDSKKEGESMKSGIAILVFLTLALLLAISVHHWLKRRHLRQMIIELREESQSQLENLGRLKQQIENKGFVDNTLKEFIISQIDVMREVMEKCYILPDSKWVQNLKDVFMFREDNKFKWTRIYDYVDMEYNNIITRTRENYPQLNDKDILLIALTAMDFSCAQIALVLGFQRATSVGAAHMRLARKMKLNTSLSSYIGQYQ